ncbi:hypothetical protein [Achromobacter ruhlandii]|uniref:hypothetical protein n=1 Tax=Achromobacter ruhlandii TaxID=72557 RepID=UPI003BA1A9E0
MMTPSEKIATPKMEMLLHNTSKRRKRLMQPREDRVADDLARPAGGSEQPGKNGKGTTQTTRPNHAAGKARQARASENSRRRCTPGSPESDARKTTQKNHAKNQKGHSLA